MPVIRSRTPHRPETPPIWYVRRGSSEDGPLSTRMLLQGVYSGHLPEDTPVRCDRFDGWRCVQDIREVRALIKKVDQHDGRWSMPQGWLPPSSEQATWEASRKALAISHGQLEPLLIGLYLAARQTDADVGLLHVFSRSRHALMTVFSLGEGMEQQEGRVVPPFDEACKAALMGRGVMGSRGRGGAHRAVAKRLNCGHVRVQGLAMLPLRKDGFLFAMIELGRWDHPFRDGDKRRLAVVAAAMEERYG